MVKCPLFLAVCSGVSCCTWPPHTTDGLWQVGGCTVGGMGDATQVHTLAADAADAEARLQSISAWRTSCVCVRRLGLQEEDASTNPRMSRQTRADPGPAEAASL